MRAIYAICGLFLVVAGAFVLRASTLSLMDARASTGWPSVAGRVLDAEMAAVRGSRTTYEPRVTYAYAVGGAAYRDSALSFSTYSSSMAYAGDAVDEFPAGAEVRVFYDPLQPGHSVLRPGPNWFTYTLPAIAAVFILFGVALVRLALRRPTGAGLA